MNANRALFATALLLSGAPLYAAPKELRHVRIVGALRAADYKGPFKEWVQSHHDDLMFTLDEQGMDRFYVALRSFQANVDGTVLLKAAGAPSIRVTIPEGSVSSGDQGNPRTWVSGKIDPADLAKVRKDVLYTIVPENKVRGYDWSVDKGVKLKLK